MSDLSIWTPVVHEFTIEGRTVTVGPLKARRFAEVQVLSRPVLRRMTPQAVESLVAEGHDDLCKLLAAATDAPRDWLDEQDSDDLLKLLGAVLEVNADFSRRRIAPALGALAETVNRALAPTGASSSPSSEASATDATTPST